MYQLFAISVRYINTGIMKMRIKLNIIFYYIILKVLIKVSFIKI